MFRGRLAACVPVVFVFAGFAVAGDAARASGVPDLDRRLSELAPSAPADYFLLAEEVHDEVRTPEDVALARRLYVLAFVLHEPGVGTDYRASVCLALADLATNEQDRRWLEALAAVVAPNEAGAAWLGRSRGAIAPDTAYLAASALGLVRAGEGRAAERVLEEPGVLDALRRYDDVLAAAGLGPTTDWVVRAAERWPCPNCRNERVVQLTRENPPKLAVCAVCEGDPGPKLSEAQLVATLRLESRLLTGIHESWAAQIAADVGMPLRDADASQLPLAMGVDAELVVYRDGAWLVQTPTIAPAEEIAPPNTQPDTTPETSAGDDPE